jgi:hypothetical protein
MWDVTPFGRALRAPLVGRSSSLELATLAGLILPAIWLAGFGSWLTQKKVAERRVAKGRCEACGYDLRANVSGVCPECGTQQGLWIGAIKRNNPLPSDRAFFVAGLFGTSTFILIVIIASL